MFFKENFKLKNLIFTILVIFIIWFITQIKEIALLFFGSYVIACSLNPIVDKISKHMPRAVASILVLLGILFATILVLLPICTISFNEIQLLLSTLPSKIAHLVELLKHTKIMGQTVIELINLETILSNTSQFASDIVSKSINITVTLLEAITVVVTSAMIVFYLTYEKTTIRHGTLRLFPPKIRKKAQEMMSAIEEKVGGYVIAQGLSMATVAIFTAIGLGLIKIEFAVLLGLIAGILDIIPIVGPTIAVTIGVLIAISAKGLVWALPTMAIFLVSQWISNNFVRPLVFGKFLDLHPLWVIFSFFVAAKFLGVWGVILAPAIAALIATLFDEMYVKVINRAKDEAL